MSPRRTKKAAGHLPLLALLIEALDEQECDDRPGEAKALRAFGRLALKQVPKRGVFAPAEDALYKAINEVARRHLALDEPRKRYLASTAAGDAAKREGDRIGGES